MAHLRVLVSRSPETVDTAGLPAVRTRPRTPRMGRVAALTRTVSRMARPTANNPCASTPRLRTNGTRRGRRSPVDWTSNVSYRDTNRETTETGPRPRFSFTLAGLAGRLSVVSCDETTTDSRRDVR